jgi:hypothetical protein
VDKILAQEIQPVQFPDSVTILPGRKTMIPVIVEKPSGMGNLELKVTVRNLIIVPAKGLTTTISTTAE